MADGTTLAIEDVHVEDLVAAWDPLTDEITAQPVLAVIAGHGDRHLVTVTTAPTSGLEGDAPQSTESPGASVDSWKATANHPIWALGRGWVNAKDLAVGDLLLSATADTRVVQSVIDEGWQQDQTVRNLSVANVHTFIVGSAGNCVAVHNCSAGGRFTPKTKAEIRHENASKNGGVLRCEVCKVKTPRASRLTQGEKKNMRSSEIDHIAPRSRGGTNAKTNGRDLCARCSNIKGAR